MIEKNPELKNKFKNNLKFIILIIVLSLIAWFGVKILVSKSGTTSATTTKKGSSLIQTNVHTGGTPPTDTGRPSL